MEVKDGYEIAALHLEKMAKNYAEDNGYQEPDTGAWVFPGNGADYLCWCEETAEEIRALKPKDPELSDLEIVQKALEKSKSMIRIYPDGTGTLVSRDESGRAVFGEFPDVAKVIAWAKQTIGQQS